MEEWYYRDRKPLLNINLFLSDNDAFYVITGRPKDLSTITNSCVNHHYPLSEVILVGEKRMCHDKTSEKEWDKLAKLKANKINELELDIYFDDEPETIVKLRELCPKTKIIYYGGRVEL